MKYVLFSVHSRIKNWINLWFEGFLFENFLVVWNRTGSKETAAVSEFYRKAEKIQPARGRRTWHGPGEGRMVLCGGELMILARGAEREK